MVVEHLGGGGGGGGGGSPLHLAKYKYVSVGIPSCLAKYKLRGGGGGGLQMFLSQDSRGTICIT